jgi:NAD(P)H-dependent FMN reductase
MSKIALITGSTRTPRVGTDVADWVFEVIKSRPEDMVPAMQQFTKEHSRKWSEAIISFQGYVFVIPEYNGSMSGATKNAIDYLYNEWPGKPVAIISYGTQGGERANKHLSESLELVMKMKVAPTKVKLAFASGNDVMTAINDGKLGDDTRKAWTEAGANCQILKAFGEVKEILEQ